MPSRRSARAKPAARATKGPLYQAARRGDLTALLDQQLFLVDMRTFRAFTKKIAEPTDPTAQKRLAKMLQTKPPWER